MDESNNTVSFVLLTRGVLRIPKKICKENLKLVPGESVFIQLSIGKEGEIVLKQISKKEYVKGKIQELDNQEPIKRIKKTA